MSVNKCMEMEAALGLMRRVPPKHTETALNALITHSFLRSPLSSRSASSGSIHPIAFFIYPCILYFISNLQDFYYTIKMKDVNVQFQIVFIRIERYIKFMFKYGKFYG